MVEMTSTIELDTLCKFREFLMVALGHSGSSLLLEGVQVVHVGLVMLAVVKLHQLLGNDWF